MRICKYIRNMNNPCRRDLCPRFDEEKYKSKNDTCGFWVTGKRNVEEELA